jgi:hypothetical protein
MNEEHSRFTLDGSFELENRLRALCEKVRASVQGIVPSTRLEALMLAGGYGRGEGGVLRTADGDQPYNDLEFYVCVKGPELLMRRSYDAALHELGEKLTPGAALEIELKLFSLSKLRRNPITMFYYDLVSGHKWVVGEESLLNGCEHHLSSRRIPLHEATRLLMNRCSGLLFSQEKLGNAEFGAEQADFVRRNICKAKLAFGDVVLTVYGQYHWSCRERHKRLSKFEPTPDLPWLEQVLAWHREGVEFKLHPYKSAEDRRQLLAELQMVKPLAWNLWAWLERKRLGRCFTDPQHYAVQLPNLCPERSKPRNFLINLRAFGPSVGPGASRYPRERLLRALPLLLWGEQPLGKRSLSHIQAQLRTSSSEQRGLVQAFTDIWRHFN